MSVVLMYKSATPMKLKDELKLTHKQITFNKNDTSKERNFQIILKDGEA